MIIRHIDINTYKKLFKSNWHFLISNQLCSSKNPEKVYPPSQTKEAQLILTIKSICWASNQHIIMSSEGLFDTEDFHNDC